MACRPLNSVLVGASLYKNQILIKYGVNFFNEITIIEIVSH